MCLPSRKTKVKGASEDSFILPGKHTYQLRSHGSRQTTPLQEPSSTWQSVTKQKYRMTSLT